MEVVVIIGSGGMGTACGRRLGVGRTVVLADADANRLATAQATLEEEGFNVVGTHVDVADRASVAALAREADGIGPIRTIVHTAAVSGSMRLPAERMFAVNLSGTIHVLDCFVGVARPGTVAVVISSGAAYRRYFSPRTEARVAEADADAVVEAFDVDVSSLDSDLAYTYTKYGVVVRVRHAVSAWAERGARVVSISPGVIATPMSRLALQRPEIRDLTAACPVGRIGTPDDIANAVEWLASPSASFVTGCDLSVDGGSSAVQRNQLARDAKAGELVLL